MVRVAVQYEVRKRMEDLVGPFIQTGTLNGFVHMLDNTQAAVVGSVCRRLLASESGYARTSGDDCEVLDQSFDLNILVPSETFDNCIQWFSSQGYTIGAGTVEWAYSRAVSEVVNAYLPVARLDVNSVPDFERLYAFEGPLCYPVGFEVSTAAFCTVDTLTGIS